MKKPHFFVLIFLAPFLALAAPKKDRPDTDIEKDMHRMGRAYHQLHRQVNDPTQNASSLALVATLKAAALDARNHTPLKAADLPAAERPAFVASYQKKMDEFLAMLASLQDALRAGDNGRAAKLVADMGKLQREDHKQFRRPEDEERKHR